MFHRSERLFLRPAWPEDWEAIYRGIADRSITCNLASAPWPYGEEDARSFVGIEQNRRLPHFLVTLPGTGAIGSVGMGEHGGQPEIGYWIARDHWGHGFATEAGRALLDIAQALGHRRINAGHFVDNPASGKVLRKLGFRPTGQIRPRASRARGCEVASVEFELELGDPAMELPQPA